MLCNNHTKLQCFQRLLMNLNETLKKGIFINLALNDMPVVFSNSEKIINFENLKGEIFILTSLLKFIQLLINQGIQTRQ